MSTPAESEARARVIAELRFLADARDEYSTDVLPAIHEQAQTARQLADILERKVPVTEGGEGWGWLPSWKWDEWDALASRVSTPPSEDSWEALATVIYGMNTADHIHHEGHSEIPANARWNIYDMGDGTEMVQIRFERPVPAVPVPPTEPETLAPMSPVFEDALTDDEWVERRLAAPTEPEEKR